MQAIQNLQFANLQNYRNQCSWAHIPPIKLPDLYYDGLTIVLGGGKSIDLNRDLLHRIIGITISRELLAAHPEFELRDLEGHPMLAFLLLYWEEIAHAIGAHSDLFDELFLMPSEEKLLQAWQWRQRKLANLK